MRVPLLAAVLCAAGCGGEPPRRLATAATPPVRRTAAGAAEALPAFARLYRDFQATKGRPPGSYGELAAHALDSSSPLPPGAAGLTVAWGTKLGDGPAAAVVARAPAAGGKTAVMTADGAVKELTADEVKNVVTAVPTNR
jgi:hypothetical protein